MFMDSNLLTSQIPQFCSVEKCICLFALIFTAVRQIKQIMEYVCRLCLRLCAAISFFKSTINQLEEWFKLTQLYIIIFYLYSLFFFWASVSIFDFQCCVYVCLSGGVRVVVLRQCDEETQNNRVTRHLQATLVNAAFRLDIKNITSIFNTHQNTTARLQSTTFLNHPCQCFCVIAITQKYFWVWESLRINFN